MDAGVAQKTTFAPSASTGSSVVAARAEKASPSRVLIATLNRPQGVTGVHTHTRVLSDGLRARGFTCDIVTPFSGSSAWTPVFALRPLLLKRFFPTAATLWYRHWHSAALRANLRAALKSNVPRHIIAQCPPSAQAAMDVREELGLTGRVDITMVCHFNVSEADEYRAQGALSGSAFGRVKAAEENTVRAVDRVIYVSGWARDLVEHDRGIAVKDSAVVWNGVPAINPTGQSVSRESIGLASSDLVLINVGTLEPRKDQIGLLPLFAQVCEKFPAARLVLVGDGPQRTAIENAARVLGIESKIKLLGHRKDVPALLELADLYVHYAAAENCPISLLEVARAALPWAARPSGGVRELIDSLGGFALAETSNASMNAIRPLLEDAAHRRAAGQNAQRLFAASFTQDAMVNAYIRVLGLNACSGGDA